LVNGLPLIVIIDILAYAARLDPHHILAAITQYRALDQGNADCDDIITAVPRTFLLHLDIIIMVLLLVKYHWHNYYQLTFVDEYEDMPKQQ
jgi:uncharacterized membrane protein